MISVHNFGKLVREKRERQRLTISEAAERCGMSTRGFEMIELGDSNPKLSSVLNIAYVFEINIGEMNICIPREELV